MTTHQLKRLDTVIFFGSLIVMIMALVLMGERVLNADAQAARFASGLLSFFLMIMGHTAVSTLKRGVFWSDWKLPAFKITLKPVVLIPEFDLFLFPSGRGVITEILPLESPPKPPQLIPGFVYIMRRSDGVYKFGKSVNPIKRQAEHSGDYEKGFEIIRLFAVSNMTVFEQLALKMTIQYSYRKEQGRKELRRMTKRQVGAFTVEFESVIRKTVI